jgi:hypothetical protein
MSNNEILYALAGLAIGWFLFRRPACSCPPEPPKSVGDMVASGQACKAC